MKKSLTIAVSALTILLFFLFIPSIYWQAIGRLRGEAFFQERPTTFWRRELERHESDLDKLPEKLAAGVRGQARSPSFLDSIMNHLGYPDNIWGRSTHALNGEVLAEGVLLDLLRDEKPRIRCGACEAFAEGALAPQSVVPVLVELLAIKDERLRFRALVALEKYENGAKVAVPAVIPFLSEPDFGIRIQAWNTLRKIDPESAGEGGIAKDWPLSK